MENSEIERPEKKNKNKNNKSCGSRTLQDSGGGVTRVRHKAKACYRADVADVCGRAQLGMSSTYNSGVPTLGGM